MIFGSSLRKKWVRIAPGRAVHDPNARRPDEPAPPPVPEEAYAALEESAIAVWRYAERLYVPSAWPSTVDEGVVGLEAFRAELDAVTQHAIKTRQAIGGRLEFEHVSELAPTFRKVAALALGLVRLHPAFPLFTRQNLESEQRLRVEVALGGIAVACVLLLVVNGCGALEKSLIERLSSVYPETLRQSFSGTDEHPYPYTNQEIAARLRPRNPQTAHVDQTRAVRKRVHDLRAHKLPAAIAGLDMEKLIEALRTGGNR